VKNSTSVSGRLLSRLPRSSRRANSRGRCS
jgi:hypothetical protein